MNADLLKKLLGRLTRANFTDFLRKWGRLPENADVFTLDGHKTKQQLVTTALKDCKKAGVTETDIDDFALLYLYHNSKRIQWTAFSIEKENENTSQKSLAPTAFKQRLWKELRKYFHVRVSLLSRDEAFWVRVVIVGEGVQNKEFIFFLVHYPHSSYVFAANLRVTHEGYVSQAFCKVVGGAGATAINLQGRCVRSLAQLTVGKAGQGSFSKFGLNQVDANPLATKKRKRQDIEDDFDVHVVNENISDKRRRRSLLEDTFGSNPQPTLEKVSYDLETNFAAVDLVPAMAQHEGPFRGRVRFEGVSVIEGMKQLGQAGLADLPMKPHVGKIQTYGQNRFLLRRKEKRNRRVDG